MVQRAGVAPAVFLRHRFTVCLLRCLHTFALVPEAGLEPARAGVLSALPLPFGLFRLFGASGRSRTYRTRFLRPLTLPFVYQGQFLPVTSSGSGVTPRKVIGLCTSSLTSRPASLESIQRLRAFMCGRYYPFQANAVLSHKALSGCVVLTVCSARIHTSG